MVDGTIEEKKSRGQSEVQQNWPDLSLPRVFVVSSGLDVASAVLTYPLWHVKTREQAAGAASSLQAVRELQRGPHGLRGLYRGAAFGTLGMLPAHFVHLVSYEWSKWHLSECVPPNAAPAVAAAFAECCWVALAMPVENVTVRVQCVPASVPLRQCGAAARDLVALCRGPEGPLRLWRGGLLGLATTVPQAAIWWLVYENTKSWLLCRNPSGRVPAEDGLVGSSVDQGVVDLRMAGGGCAAAAVLASCLTTLLTNPLDVLKARAQAGGHPAQSLASLSRLGGTPLWRLVVGGLGPRLLLVSLAGLSESAVYEATMHYGTSCSSWGLS
ncbi:unnamed protein product [Polarella glacialis]|uniref:Mitochondrial carrier protein n=1 Tax=Polarella glacialis TaxID=89957 RepID=A0A813ERK8_POLGL|nr:unnamed protein product [Polarella glacialis]